MKIFIVINLIMAVLTYVLFCPNVLSGWGVTAVDTMLTVWLLLVFTNLAMAYKSKGLVNQLKKTAIFALALGIPFAIIYLTH